MGDRRQFLRKTVSLVFDDVIHGQVKLGDTASVRRAFKDGTLRTNSSDVKICPGYGRVQYSCHSRQGPHRPKEPFIVRTTDPFLGKVDKIVENHVFRSGVTFGQALGKLSSGGLRSYTVAKNSDTSSTVFLLFLHEGTRTQGGKTRTTRGHSQVPPSRQGGRGTTTQSGCASGVAPAGKGSPPKPNHAPAKRHSPTSKTTTKRKNQTRGKTPVKEPTKQGSSANKPASQAQKQ